MRRSSISVRMAALISVLFAVLSLWSLGTGNGRAAIGYGAMAVLWVGVCLWHSHQRTTARNREAPSHTEESDYGP